MDSTQRGKHKNISPRKCLCTCFCAMLVAMRGNQPRSVHTPAAESQSNPAHLRKRHEAPYCSNQQEHHEQKYFHHFHHDSDALLSPTKVDIELMTSAIMEGVRFAAKACARSILRRLRHSVFWDLHMRLRGGIPNAVQMIRTRSRGWLAI